MPDRSYETQVALVMRMGNWLMSPQAMLLPGAEWAERFREYQRELDELRRLADERRPAALSDRSEPLAGDALLPEVMELFNA